MSLRAIYQALVAACILMLLGGCSSSETRMPGDDNGNPDDPLAVDEITSENAVMLSRSSLDLVSRLVVIGHIAIAMVRDSMDIMNNPSRVQGDLVNIPECASSPAGYGPETNRITYMVFGDGFRLPAGDALHVALAQCTVEGNLLDNSFVDIAGLEISGDPSAASGNWSIEAFISLGPVQFINDNGTLTSITDNIIMTASRSSGVTTMTLAVGSDAGTGQVGGLNAQLMSYPPVSGVRAINYQLRPFYLVVTDDANTQEYSVAVQSHPTDGASILNRYVSNPSSEILLRVSTNSSPVLWSAGRPDDFSDTPAAGAVRFSETDCTSCGSILATVQGDGVALTINDGAAVTSDIVEWADLVAPPDLEPGT